MPKLNRPISPINPLEPWTSWLPVPSLPLLSGVLLIAGLVFLIYWPVVHGGFILDDDVLVTDNALVKAPDGLYRMWFTREPVDYWPVTNTSFWIQWRLWGMNPTGYHVINLLLHIVNSLLIWLLLRRLLIPGAFLAALLFTVHPVNVESVAWIAQLKNVLSLLFFLLSLLWYVKAQGFLNRWYWFSLLAFILAMLSKGSVAILPLVLLLVVWRQRKRITTQDIQRTVPFFLVAVALTAVNIWFQTHGSETAIRTATFAQRLAGAGAAVWFYLFKAILPLNLAFVYPQWNIDVANPLWWLPLITAVFVTMILYHITHSSNRGFARNLLFAWVFFCLALMPVLGFVDVGYMKHSLVADHYQYIALIGIVTVVAVTGAYWHNQLPASKRKAFTTCGAIAVLFLAFLTWRQSHIYASSIGLYKATLRQNPTSWLLHTNLSVELANVDRASEAMQHAEEALRLKPDYAEAHAALGVALAKQGKTDQAIDQYRLALDINPNFAEAACNLGAALGGKGQMPQAIEYLQRAVQLKPYFFEAHSNLARALAAVGRLQEALVQLQTAMQLNPNYVDGEINMGNIAYALGHKDEALTYYQQALRIRPDFPEDYIRLALIDAEMNRPNDAIAAAQKGLELAQANGQTELAGQIETWLTNYRNPPASSPTQHH